MQCPCTGNEDYNENCYETDEDDNGELMTTIKIIHITIIIWAEKKVLFISFAFFLCDFPPHTFEALHLFVFFYEW